MFIDRISVENYRNYTSLDIQLSNDVNIFYGNNGQGKTNLLEALYYNVIGKSFRNTKDHDIIRKDSDKDCFEISTHISDDITETIYIKYNKNKEKFIKVNGLYLRKIGHLMGSVLAVIFSPEDMQLISEGPSIRRKFMDIAISQIKASYYFDLLQYNKILVQKNNLIRNIKYDKSKNYGDILSVWNEQLASAGAKIILERAQLIDKLGASAADKHSGIAVDSAEKNEILSLSYKSDISREIIESNDVNRIKDELFKLSESRREKEIEREMSLYGPHRDDIDFKLNDNDLKRFGSQGQKRTAILSVKMAELEIIEKASGRKPVLILDDVLSELDDKRQKSFLCGIDNVQTFISCTEIDSIDIKNRGAEFFKIKNGHVEL